MNNNYNNGNMYQGYGNDMSSNQAYNNMNNQMPNNYVPNGNYDTVYNDGYNNGFTTNNMNSKPPKKQKKWILLLLLLLIVVAIFTYLNVIKKDKFNRPDDDYEEFDPNYGIEESNSNVAVNSISISPSSISVGVGATTNVSVNITPSNVTNQSITWKSKDTSIATVDKNGNITGKKAGKTTITATCDGKTATATVTVVKDNVAVKGISLNKTSLTVEAGSSSTLSVSFNPSNATNKGLTWKSSDTSVATVSTSGKVTGIKEGKATITVTSKDGNKNATSTVTVVTPQVKSITINVPSTTIYESHRLGTITTTATVTYSPSNATGKSVTWKSSNPSVATVDQNGLITSVAEGDTVITATTPNGVTAKKTINVRYNPRNIRISAICTAYTDPNTGETVSAFTPDLLHAPNGDYLEYKHIYYGGKKYAYGTVIKNPDKSISTVDVVTLKGNTVKGISITYIGNC